MTGELVRPPAPGDPERLGRWELCGRLGEGGMGTVHLGRAGRRLAAVKTLRVELLGDARFLARFRREVEAARAARSSYVAAVLEVGPAGPVPWFASEFVAGPTLEACVAGRGPLPGESVRALGGMLARALAALHSAGVVHRDLKPSNVLLTTDGPRVVDFGIARQLGATSLTGSGQMPGSEGYMSPEQVLGRELGPPSDVFVLGALLSYASTGHHAFGVGAQPAAYAIAYEEPEERGEVPVALRETLRRCLSKEPGDRPTAEQLAEDWKGPTDGWLPDAVLRDIAALRRQAEDITGVRLREPGGHFGRRRVLSAGAVLLAGAGAGAWWLGREPGTRAPETNGPPLWKGGPGEVPDPLWSTGALAPEAPFGPTPAGPDVVLVAARGAVAALDPRTGEQRWTHPGGLAPVAAPRPLLIGADGRLRALGADDGKEAWRGPGSLTRLLAADRDTVYALGPGDRVVAVRTDDGTRVWQVTAPAGDLAAAAPGVLVLAGPDGRVHALDARTGTARWSVDTGGRKALRPAYGTDVAVLGGPALRAVALRDGSERWRLAPSSTAFGAPVVSGSRVYVADGYVMRCLDLASGDRVWEHIADGGSYSPSAVPFTVVSGLYLPLVDPADGVAALPTRGGSERYRFQAAGEGAAWTGAGVGGVVLWQCGARLYALPPF